MDESEWQRNDFCSGYNDPGDGVGGAQYHNTAFGSSAGEGYGDAWGNGNGGSPSGDGFGDSDGAGDAAWKQGLVLSTVDDLEYVIFTAYAKENMR